MVYNTQNYGVFGLCPLSGILNIRQQLSRNQICFRPQVTETSTVLGPLERGVRLALCEGPDSVGVPLPLAKDANRSSFQNTCVL
jgi:hypothetical protein